MCFEVNVEVVKQMVAGVLEYVFTLCNHHKEYHFCEMNLYGKCVL